MNQKTQNIVCSILACIAVVFGGATYHFYNQSVSLASEIEQNNAKLSAAKTAVSKFDDLNAQIADLQTQLDAAKADLSEKADEQDSIETLTQQAYEEGWEDACYEYDLEPDEEDIGNYDYTAHLDEGEPSSPTAYITPTGKRYHLLQSCAGQNAIQTTIAKASEQGYTPCIKCAQ